MRETPLTEWHRQHGAKMMEFGGFLMPIEYGSGILQEHIAVRETAGMFDVSHMGEFLVSGPKAATFLDYLVTNAPSRLEPGQVLYSPLCYPTGGTVDDLLVYRLSDEEFMLVVNAGNIAKDWAWLGEIADGWDGIERRDVSQTTGLIALQGPNAEMLLQPLVNIDLTALTYYHAQRASLGSDRVVVSRTGYTGEDGFEIYVKSLATQAVWERLVHAGGRPVGLGARDTLRLEARLPLYDHELSPEITPLEAGLTPFIKWDKEDFVGKAALVQQKADGVTRRAVGLTIDGGIARAGYSIVAEPGGAPVGQVTSGTMAPTLGHPVALALVQTAYAKVGTSLYVQIRGRDVPALVVKTPFYRRISKTD